MFQFPAFTSLTYVFSEGSCGFSAWRFRISEISGSKPGWRLPGAYRSRPTSFIVFRRQNIHHELFVA
jgi:hypothetical protein